MAPQEPSAGEVLCGKKSFLVKKVEENAGGKEGRFWSDPNSVRTPPSLPPRGVLQAISSLVGPQFLYL